MSLNPIESARSFMAGEYTPLDKELQKEFTKSIAEGGIVEKILIPTDRLPLHTEHYDPRKAVQRDWGRYWTEGSIRVTEDSIFFKQQGGTQEIEIPCTSFPTTIDGRKYLEMIVLKEEKTISKPKITEVEGTYWQKKRS